MIVAEHEGPGTGFATLSVDVLGGDYGPEVTVPAAISSLAKDPGIKIVLVGQQAAIESALANAGRPGGSRLGVHYASGLLPADARPRLLPLNSVGFVEGSDIFSGKVDVAVCGGFAGKLIQKSSEGLARFLAAKLEHALKSGFITRLGAVLVEPALRRLMAQLDPSAHNGAPSLGLRSVVLNSHGSASCVAMNQAILEAGREARQCVPKRIEASVRAFKLETDA